MFHGPDCFTVSTLCTYTDLGSRGYFGVWRCSCMGESFPSPDGFPSRQSRLGPFLWFVQNRWEKFWGIIGGGLAVGLQSRLALGLWLVKYWAVHKGCKQTLPAFNYNKLLIGFCSAVLIGVKTNWSPIIACPGLTRSSPCLTSWDLVRPQPVYNKASLVAIMVIALALVDVSGGRTTWWRTEACCQKSWMCWMQFSEGYWIICLH